jgi:DNA-binding transcriptional LysR family regulator
MKDLNLLRAFEAVWATRSVSKAAERLSLTQPAVSSALARLRASYGDPLFTRVGNRMEPTPLCAERAPFLLDALGLIDRSLAARSGFEAATSTRTFTLGMRDIGEATLLPAVVTHCARQAPGVCLQTVLSPLETTSEKLADGRVDLAVGYLPALQAGIHRRILFNQRYVCVMRRGNPLAQGRFGIKELKRAEHLSIDYTGTGHALVERQLRDQGLDRSTRLRIPHYLAAPPLLAVTDLVCLMPQMLASLVVDKYGLVSRPVPLKSVDFPIALYWHDRFHREQGNVWLRGVFTALHHAVPAQG